MPYTIRELRAKIASNDYGAELCLQHAMSHIEALEMAVAALREDAERLDWIERQHLEELSMQLVMDAEHDGSYYVRGDSNTPGYGPSLRAAIDAARSFPTAAQTYPKRAM